MRGRRPSKPFLLVPSLQAHLDKSPWRALSLAPRSRAGGALQQESSQGFLRGGARVLPPKGHPKIEAPKSRRKGWPPMGKRPGGGPVKDIPVGLRRDRGKASRGHSPRWLLREGAAVKGPGGGEYRWLLRGEALEDPPLGDPRGAPSEEGTVRETPWSASPMESSEERRLGSCSGEMVSLLCPERDPRGKTPRSQPRRALIGCPRWRPPRRFSAGTPGGRSPCLLLRGEAGPGTNRWGNPWRIPPRRGPVGRHPRSDAHGRSSEEIRRGDAPAGRGQGQGGRDLVGVGSEEPAPARRLEGAARGSLRRGRNGYGPRGRHPGGPPRRLSGAGPLLALTKAGRTRLQGFEPDQESVHPAGSG